MSKKYEQLAKDIVKKVGGDANIDTLHHCQTRLRFKLVDNSKVEKEELSSLDGVAKVVSSGGMLQIVIGMHVAEVYEEAIKFISPKGDDSVKQVESDPNEKMSPFDTVTSFISSIFAPIVPALAGAGMVKALLALLVAFKLVDPANQTYVIINMISDSTFAFLPILLAYTSAQKLKCNPIIAMAVAGIMVHATWGGLVTAGEPVHLFGVVPLYLVRYTSSVIPIILVMLIQAPLEKKLNKIMPKSINLVFVPMIVFLVMGVLALSVLGPLGNYIGNALNVVFTWLSVNASWAPPLLIGATFPIMVMFGLHHGIAPIGSMSLMQLGYDAIFGPGVLCSNIAQGIASLIAAYLSKDSKTKQIGISAGVAGLMGITEPALYGVNLPKKYPLVAAMIGGGIGGFVAGITKTRRFATGSSGLPAVVMYIGDDTLRYFYQILISLGVTIVVTAVITFVLAKKYEAKSK